MNKLSYLRKEKPLRKKPISKSGSVMTYGDPGIKALSTVTGLVVALDNLTVSWNEVEGAEGYILKCHVGNNTDWGSASEFPNMPVESLSHVSPIDLDGKTVLIKAVKGDIESNVAASLFYEAPSTGGGFEFGATDAQAAMLDPNAIALPLISTNRGRFIMTPTVDTRSRLQVQDTVDAIPFPAGSYVLPANTNSTVALEMDVLLPDLTGLGYQGSLFAALGYFNPAGAEQALAFVSWDGVSWSVITNTFSLVFSLGVGGAHRIAMDYQPGTGAVTFTSGASTWSGTIGAVTGESVLVMQVVPAMQAAGSTAGNLIEVELIQNSTNFTETHAGGVIAIADALVEKP
jgi:hypothetical protein